MSLWTNLLGLLAGQSLSAHFLSLLTLRCFVWLVTQCCSSVPTPYSSKMNKALCIFFAPQALLWGMYAVLQSLLHPTTVDTLLFYTLQSLLVFVYSNYAIRRRRKFPTLIAEIMCFRLSTSLTYAALVLWVGTSSPTTFVLHFVLLYLVYLLFELFFFFHIFAKPSESVPSQPNPKIEQKSSNRREKNS